MKSLQLIMCMLMISFTYSQEKTIISDLEDLTLNIGEVFKPNSKVVNSDGSEAECNPDGETPCCNFETQYRQCGSTSRHCQCQHCVD